MKTIRTFLISLLILWVVAEPAPCATTGAVDLPWRIDPLSEPAPNGTTVLLWRFDDGKPTDATIGGSHGQVHGAVQPAEGRYGSAVRFPGGDAAILRKVSAGMHVSGTAVEGVSLVMDFWCRPEASPGRDICLLEFLGQDEVRLMLDPGMKLCLRRRTGDKVEAAKPLAAGKWFHVSLLWRSFLQPNRVFGDGSGVELLIDGHTAGVLWDAPAADAKAADSLEVCLGNTFRRDAGFAGTIDEFRISRGAAGVCPIVEQVFAERKADPPSDRSDVYFRNPTAKVYDERFDDAASLRRISPPEDPVFLNTAPRVMPRPGMARADLPGPAEKLEGFALEIIQEQKGLNRSVQLVRGVRGQGVLVRGGAARIDLSRPAMMPAGTLEFWFKPGNWDNLAVPSLKATPAGSQVHLITLWGLPEGQGKAQPLASLKLNRASGAEAVRPEYRKYFQRPRMAIVPNVWRHVLITWSDRFPHLEGCGIDGEPFDVSIAPPATWRTQRAAYLTVGNGYDTALDELALHGYPLEGVERRNARADFTGEPMLPLAEERGGQVVESLGAFPVASGDSQLPTIAGAWLTGWVSGAPERGAARTFFGFRPEVGEMIVAVAPLEPKPVQRAEVALQLDGGKSVRGEIPAFQDGKGGVVLPVGPLPPGDYRLTGSLFGAGGAKGPSFESTFRRERLPSVECELGIVDQPPEPFTPVEVKGNLVRAVGRSYDVGPDGNFRAIEVLGEQILASPIRLEAQAGGKTFALQGTGVRFGPQRPVGTDWSAASEGAGLAVRSTVKFEYDGLAVYDIEVRPAAGQTPLERLSLQIPLKAEYAQLFHVLGPNSGLRDPHVAGALAPGEGVVWNSKTDAPFLRGDKSRTGSMVAQMWLGGAIRGIAWYADNDRGWVPNHDQPAVTVTRTGAVVTLGLHFISQPFTLREPRRIFYQLLGTPPKPLPKDHRLWGRGHLEKAGKVGGRITSCDSFAPFAIPCRAATFAYWPPNDDWDLIRMAAARQRQGDGGKYPPGQALMLYHDKVKCPCHPQMLAYYGWSWGASRYPKARINHLIWYLDKLIDCGYDGVYIDDVFPIGEWNAEPVGTSYIFQKDDGSGTKHCGSAHGPYREYLKRLYNVFLAHGKRPIITTHMSTTLGWPYHSFATVAFDHEQSSRFTAPNGTFIDAWPLDYLMTLDNPERSGLVTVPMLKGAYLKNRSPLQVWAALRSFLAVRFLFDHNMPLEGTVLAPYYGTDVEVYPFWRNAHLVTVTPQIEGKVTDKDLPAAKWWKMEHFRQSIAAEPLRATLYKKKDRAMLIVANFLRRSVGCRATLNLDALGIPAAVRDRLKVVDVDSARPPGGADLGKLHLADNHARTLAPPQIGDLEKDRAGDNLKGPAGAPTGDDGEIEALIGSQGQQQGDPKAEGFFTLETRGNTFTLHVGPHNFRAVELRW